MVQLVVWVKSFMLNTLADIATVKGGHPFRGKISEDKAGDAYAVQIKDIDEFAEVRWDNLICTSLYGRKSPDWLAKGDILFAARGQNNVAACIGQVSKPTVCAPHFFVIRVKPEVDLLPEFLAWQLNQIPAQKYFSQSAEGSAQLSIRRAVVELTPVVVPDINTQQSVIAYSLAVQQENKALKELINNRARQMHCVAQNILLKK